MKIITIHVRVNPNTDPAAGDLVYLGLHPAQGYHVYVLHNYPPSTKNLRGMWQIKAIQRAPHTTQIGDVSIKTSHVAELIEVV